MDVQSNSRRRYVFTSRVNGGCEVGEMPTLSRNGDLCEDGVSPDRHDHLLRPACNRLEISLMSEPAYTKAGFVIGEQVEEK
jgi:hypothetical protein